MYINVYECLSIITCTSFLYHDGWSSKHLLNRILLCIFDRGIRFSWVDAYMYEQSPFTIMDFILQRRRWFCGLWLVCGESNNKIPLKCRLVLFWMVLAWAFSPVPFVVTSSSSLLSISSKYGVSGILLTVMSSITCWSYLLGFINTYRLSDGLVRYAVLLFSQLVLQPVFAYMECAGVLYAIIRPANYGFHVVQKEGKSVKK